MTTFLRALRVLAYMVGTLIIVATIFTVSDRHKVSVDCVALQQDTGIQTRFHDDSYFYYWCEVQGTDDNWHKTNI